MARLADFARENNTALAAVVLEDESRIHTAASSRARRFRMSTAAARTHRSEGLHHRRRRPPQRQIQRALSPTASDRGLEKEVLPNTRRDPRKYPAYKREQLIGAMGRQGR